MRAARYILVGLAGLVLLLVLLTSWLLWTQSGARFALARAEGFLPDGIDAGEVSGDLASRLVLTDVRIRMEAMTVAVGEVVLDWQPLAAIGGELTIDELLLDDITYEALPVPDPPSESAAPFSLPEQVQLPVAISVKQFRATDISAVPAPDAEPVRIEQVAFKADFKDSHLDLRDLQVESEPLTLAANASVTASGDYPLDLAADWTLRLAGYAPLIGETAASGSLADLELDQTLDSPYNISLEAQIEGLADDPANAIVGARLDIDGASLEKINADYPPVVVGISARGDGPVDEMNITARIEAEDAEAQSVIAQIAAVVGPDAVRIERLDVTQPGRPGELEGRGTIALGDEVNADLLISWQSLQWPPVGTPTIESPTGELSITGPLDNYTFVIDTRLENKQAPPVALRLEGEGSTESARATFTGSTDTASLSGEFDAQWAPAIEAEVHVTANDFDPSIIASNWPGNIDLTLDLRAFEDGEMLRADVTTLAVDGSLRDLELAVDAKGDYRQGSGSFRANVDTFEARYGSTTARASGVVSDAVDLEWQVDSDDIGTLLPGAEGSIEGSGTAAGSFPRLDVTASLTGAGLAWDGNRLGRLELNADVDLASNERSTLRLTAGSGTIAGRELQGLTLAAAGTAADHRLDLDLSAQDLSTGIALTGTVDNPWSDEPIWHFRLQEGAVALAGKPAWQLNAPAAGVVTAASQRIDEHCWTSPEGEVCFGVRNAGTELAATVDIDSFMLDQLDPLLPEDYRMTGAISGTAQATRIDGQLTATASFETTAGDISMPAVVEGVVQDIERTHIPFEPSRIAFTLDDRARLEATLNLAEGTVGATVATAASIIPGVGEDIEPQSSPLDGRLALDFPDISFLADLVPQLSEIGGTIDGAITFAGTAGNPGLGGAIRLRDGFLQVEEQGVEIRELAMTLSGRDEGIGIEAQAASGEEGSLSIDGEVDLFGEALTAALAIDGSNFLLVDSDQAQLRVTPDLRITANADRIDVNGSVRIPSASITPEPQPPSAVTASGDQVLLEEKVPRGDEETGGRDLYADVRIILGDSVAFSGFGLSARFEGEVRARQTPGSPTLASGELRILEGEYRAYGQGLVIEEGRIYFANTPITEPAIDVQAVRRPREGILVGATVQGSLEEPEFELFSEPPMTQQEQLSWLVLGRSLDETSGGEGSALARAALALGLRGGDSLAKNIGENLGVDEFGIKTGSGEAGAASDPQQAQLVVGKYLSPKLYLSYGVGLFEPGTILKLQYDISQNWKLLTESGTDTTGADIIFSGEFGGE